MTRIYDTEVLAQQEGWHFLTDFQQVDQRYKVLAEREMGGVRKCVQGFFIRCICLITCGSVLKFNWIRMAKEELDRGKVFAEIFCRGIRGTSQVVHSSVRGPQILSNAWGSIQLACEGALQIFKDVAILGMSARNWEWAWDGNAMHHHPGIRIRDIDHYFFSRIGIEKPDVVILSTGRGHGGQLDNPGPGILEVASDVEAYIRSKGIGEVHILKTAAAIQKYNAVRAEGGKRIFALIHTTC